MIARGKVSVVWQIIFSFIPGILIWSFYRIKKLRLFLVMMAVPAHVIIYILILVTVGPEFFMECLFAPFSIIQDDLCMNEIWFVPNFAVNMIYYAFRTFFIIKWSREWNRKFEQRSTEFT